MNGRRWLIKRVRFVTFRKPNRPWQIAGAPVATTGHQATKPADGVAQCNARRKDVRELPQWHFAEDRFDYGGERCANQSAVVNEPGADLENIDDGFAREF